MAEESGGRGSWFGWALLLGLGVLYVLSVGPALGYFHWSGGRGSAFLDTVYAPLWWLYDNTEVQEPLEAYLRLWRWTMSS